MRVRNKPWAKEYLQSEPDVVIQEPAAYRGNWLNGRAEKELHVEVGSGKGRFLSGMASMRADCLFIGIEKHESVVVSTLQKRLDANVRNAFILHEDANHLETCFAPEEVSAFYLNFSDPWPKKRHAKRRLTHRSFLQMYERLLVPGGGLQLKTDNRGLFAFSIEEFSNRGWQLQNLSLDLHADLRETEDTDSNYINVETEYEQKFSEKGFPIYKLWACPPANRENSR
ncbi:tRNA (guanosine(46)-N7)-methyltransferase TrmB [Bacillaceae bacterium SIJ1]|uniref:tRNA (guanosine(46)-N7)-methyltransferase TrmB n=1 Tax=Litoribacterium kuwaitense TaxID=1398745 RepID=UPI0013EA6ECD|nr:tRNA (guanosine(46)-N7)-methyltransferase TrmB [Litoribacterium kuwaitense]NGP44213.1 tRNA (guanosine(46)-N7)-methyltransferase TrmB [Litoribacterium kuwaitense]